MEDTKEQLIIELNYLINSRIVKVISGGSNGSIIVLDIGENAIIFIDSAWRLTQGNTVLATWRDSNDPLTGNLVMQTRLLTSDIIKSISINNFFDLSIKTLSEKELYVFCDIGTHNTDELEENWSIANKSKNSCYTVKANRQLYVSKYS